MDHGGTGCGADRRGLENRRGKFPSVGNLKALDEIACFRLLLLQKKHRKGVQAVTIKEFATSKGISTQAVYQRLKTAGINIESIREGKTAVLTPEGEGIVNGLFSKDGDKEANKTSEFLKEIETLKRENQLLKESLEEARRQRDQWAEQAAEAQKTAQQAQALNLAALQNLPAPGRRSFWERITGKK